MESTKPHVEIMYFYFCARNINQSTIYLCTFNKIWSNNKENVSEHYFVLSYLQSFVLSMGLLMSCFTYILSIFMQ